MFIPLPGCLDPSQWEFAVADIFEEMRAQTVAELIIFFDVDPEAPHYTRREVFERYMTEHLGVPFKYRAPTKEYPIVFIELKLSDGKYEVRFALTIPRSLADFLKVEGAAKLNRALLVSSVQSRAFQAYCLCDGIVADEVFPVYLDTMIAHHLAKVEIATYRQVLIDNGLSPDELLEWLASKV